VGNKGERLGFVHIKTLGHAVVDRRGLAPALGTGKPEVLYPAPTSTFAPKRASMNVGYAATILATFAARLTGNWRPDAAGGEGQLYVV
jgi:hypothetical protein